MSVLKRFARALLGSKKAVASAATAVLALAAPVLRRIGIDVTPEQVQQVIVIGVGYVAAQSIADHGKEAAKVHAEAAPVAKPRVAK